MEENGPSFKGDLSLRETAPQDGAGPRLPADDLAPGTSIGEYCVEAKIGEGGMGSVYAVAHPLIGKKAAVKIMNMQLSVDASAVERFVAEARTVNQIGHPNIVDVFAFGRLPDGRSYFVMEWLQGESLQLRMARQRLGVHEALEVLVQVCEALEAAHDKGIVHRDLKPENIFVTPVRGRRLLVKLLDFGIAKLLREGAEAHKTRDGMFIGTPGYMSPEQARGKEIDHRTDIYALGVTAFEMLSGELPFDADNAMDVVHMHLTNPSPSLSSRWPEAPPELEALLSEMLSKDPDGRPPLAQVANKFTVLRDAYAPRRDSDPHGIALRITPWVGSPVVAPLPSTEGSVEALGSGASVLRRRGRPIATLGGLLLSGGVLALLSLRVASVSLPSRPVAASVAPLPVVAASHGSAAEADPVLAMVRPPAEVTLHIDVANATVRCDGKVMAESTAKARLRFSQAGEHSLVVIAPHRKPYRRSITVEPGRSIELDVKLERVPGSGAVRADPRSRDYVIDPFGP
jgi:serine/threonine protein kinase